MDFSKLKNRFIRHVNLPSNLGVIEQPAGRAVGVGQCGDSVEVTLQVNGERIIDIRHLPRGCAFTIACASAMTELARNRTLEQALDICEALGDGIGVAVDVYHVWWDPKLRQQIERAGKKRVLAYHICDWLVPTRDLLNDRGMMGDGVIDLPRIRGWVEGAGYDGFHEVEIFSELDWWKRDPEDVLRTLMERFEKT